jgi:hypothetical protein
MDGIMFFPNILLRKFLRVMLSSCAAGVSLVVALPGSSARAQDAPTAQQAAPILTIIVTRHGVRSYKAPGADSTPQNDKAVDRDEAADEGVDDVALNNAPLAKYKWANWNIVDGSGQIKPNDLTRHGYVLMTIMGNYYKHELSPDKNNPQFDCGKLFVYADVDQRTLGTAHALVEGLCGSPSAVKIFHEVNPNQKDPLFNATEWASKPSEYGRNPENSKEYKILPEMSAAAILASVKGDVNNQTKDLSSELSGFQGLLDKRCSGQKCLPLIEAEPKFKDASPLASLSGPADTGRTYAEDVFLEYAQCGDIANPIEKASQLGQSNGTSPSDLDGLQSGLAVHVRGYAINGRDDFMNKDPSKVYNPFIRGETLLWHIVALMDQRAGRATVSKLAPIGKDATPGELDGKSVVIFSGHDTTLAELGGMLSAHWTPPSDANIVRDDMPPGSALVFNLLNQNGTYRVRIGFATMWRDRFLREAPLSKDWSNDGVRLYPVKIDYPFKTGACGQETCDLLALEDLASANAKRGDRDIASYAWTLNGELVPKDPKNVAGLYDPKWTKCP